jgi:hypothetical protein
MRTVLLAAFVLFAAPATHGQAASDPTGHWEGTIQTQGIEIPMEMDLSKNASGQFTGTYGQPSQKLKGFPMVSVTVDGAAIAFTLPASGGVTFKGTILADGQSMSGEVSGSFGTAPFSVARTGDAHVYAPPTSAPIPKTMEGTWNGTLDVDGGLRVVVKLSNHADGTSTGMLISVDQGELELPVAIDQKASHLTLDVKSVSSSYSADLNAAGTELVGTYTTAQGLALPLTLRRAALERQK